ncbi:MAG: U32 family peptidase [Clostridia bacterium]|nr:U32 family peptidase [Clostridia bacterium]
MENLAPAGNRAALERADAAGADAVYLGYAAFSARAGAGNFNRQELEDAIRYAHLRHMRVHVTVNTLVKDGELEQVTEVLRLLNDLHADAVLVQDLGVLRIARNLFPGLTVHASTQMAIHNRTGVVWCGKQGIRRAVLARECSLEEIRKCADTGVEIEVFVHGAQCVAVSGLCLFSSMVGERSGNRGRCAQPCRMEYDYRGRRGAWLSPRDVCLRDELPKLAEAGVASCKIEGRLKRPEYVATVASSYRKGMDSLERGNFEKADEAEKEGLLQIFNRGGFMKGYALGCEDAGVIFPDTVNHQGVRIGRVTAADGKLAKVQLEKDLRNGDGLSLRGAHEEISLVYAGPDLKTGETAILRLRPDVKAKGGDIVFRLTAVDQLEKAEAMKGRTVPVDLFLKAMPGETLRLTATDGENTVTVTGDIVEAAKTRAVTEEELGRSLEKTGDTVFVPREVKAKTAGAFVPVSRVNALRREALSALAEERISAFEACNAQCTMHNAQLNVPEEYLPEGKVPEIAYIRTKEQAQTAREAGLRVVWCPEDYRAEALQALKAEIQPGDWLALPDVCEEETLQALRRYTEENRERLGGVVLGSVGQLGTDWPVAFAAGAGVPVMNRQAASLLLEEGCAFITASPELTGQELKILLAGGAPIVTTVYGRTRLMLLHHCPARTALGLKKGHAGCRMCDEGHPDALKDQVLEDRKGYRFPLLRQRLPEGCLVQLMNAFPTDIINSEFRIQNSELNRAVVLTTEDTEETRMILEAFEDGRKTDGKTTSGHWKRPVE